MGKRCRDKNPKLKKKGRCGMGRGVFTEKKWKDLQARTTKNSWEEAKY